MKTHREYVGRRVEDVGFARRRNAEHFPEAEQLNHVGRFVSGLRILDPRFRVFRV